MKKFVLSALSLILCASMYAFAPTSVMVINLSSNGFTDEELRLVEDADFSSAYDFGMDAPKYYDESNNAVMYVLSGLSECPKANKFATDNLNGTKLGFVSNKLVAAHRITFSTVMGSAQYYLIDKFLGASLAIAQGVYYDFEAPLGTQIDNRFEIHAINEVPGMIINAHEDPEVPGDFYSTFYHGARNFELPAGTEAYVAKLFSVDELKLVKVASAGQIIPHGHAVILKSNANTINLANADGTPVIITAQNDLLGLDYEQATPTGVSCYVFSGHSTNNDIIGIGFYLYEGAKLAANKAYVLGEPNNAPKRLRFVFAGEQGTTAIENVEAEVKAHKFIENGQIYIMHNGIKYNVQGQIVK